MPNVTVRTAIDALPQDLNKFVLGFAIYAVAVHVGENRKVLWFDSREEARRAAEPGSGITRSNVPNPPTYVLHSNDRVTKWRARNYMAEGFGIGIVWMHFRAEKR